MLADDGMTQVNFHSAKVHIGIKNPIDFPFIWQKSWRLKNIMSAEFQLIFNDEKWYITHQDKIANKIRSLNTYIEKNDSAYLLSGTESISNEENWLFDVRFFLEDKSIFIEISAHPLSIEKDLEALFTWLRKQTGIVIFDEDGELAGW